MYLHGSYRICRYSLYRYLLPLWDQGRKKLKKLIRRLLRPFRDHELALRLIAGASVKLLFISCLLYIGSSHALQQDRWVRANLQSLMQVEAVTMQRELVVFDPTVRDCPCC